MLISSLQHFCARREIYKENFNKFLELQELTSDDVQEILNALSTILVNYDYCIDVAEYFPQLLLLLLKMTINKDFESSSTKMDADLFHRVNCTVIGKLILIHPDVLGFALSYFESNPAPFEIPNKNLNEPRKIKRYMSQVKPRKVSDYEIVIATYNILQASPENFKYQWNWSKFFKYLTNDDDKVKWLAIKCIAIVLEMSEALQLNCAKAFISGSEKFILEDDQDKKNIDFKLEKMLTNTEELAKTCSSVTSVAGVLLPVFKKDVTISTSNLISVPSMEENLRSLALAVASRKCICLQGPVGCGKTAVVEHLVKVTGRGSTQFSKVQLGDQTDSKMLLGSYRCTDIPGEFIWQAGILTEAITSGKWLLLEDIDSAALDVASVLSNLLETGTLSVPGYQDTIHVASGFQLFVTQRLIPTMNGFYQQSSGTTSLLEKYWFKVNIEPLSQEELIIVIKSLFPVLSTIAAKIVDVFLLFSVGRHETNFEEDEALKSIMKSGRQISTRDLIKWCTRAAVDFNVSSPESALKILQDAIDIFCCSVSNQGLRLKLATTIANKLGIINTKADYFVLTHRPFITLTPECFIGGRARLERKKYTITPFENCSATYSFTRPSACLLERITSCVAQLEPVLLVGETGTGKTSSIQYLARSTGHKLVVINMNQQSESADLLGGYKPVDLRVLIFPIREEFEILFRSYFAVEPNQKFLSHIGTCYDSEKWKTLVALMSASTNAALKRLHSPTNNGVVMDHEKESKNKILREKWQILSQKLEKLGSQVKIQSSIAFSFIEGSLVKALKEGHWVLLDEINLANAETLECLSGLLEGSSGSLSLLERGDKESVVRHPDFTMFACMNPATDVGKKELPIGLRNRFTEFYIDELEEHGDLLLLVESYLKDLNLPINIYEAIVKFYLNVKKEATWTLSDGTAHKPLYSLRTLCRALSVAAANPCGTVLRSLYEAFCMSFLTQLDHKSYPIVQKLIDDAILGRKSAKAVVGMPIAKPQSQTNEDYINFEGYWVVKGNNEPEVPKNYILTPSIRRNLKDVVRVVSVSKMPILLQGDTSVGKTSLITYLARASGQVCLRINNHEHTDLQEYVGCYVADESGKLVFKEGILVEAMRKGYWIILDELNLAPSDVLEALNRVLDDNRELFIPETQDTVKAHKNFMLFATQNPPGVYGGRKVLSRAFRNRFVELHFDEIPTEELQIILHERCLMPDSYCKQIIAVMQELQIRRKNTAAFAGKKGFITLRDLFRWGERYRLAPNVEGLYNWSQHLADEGYLVLSAKVRKPEEAEEIKEVIKKHLKCDVEPENLFTLHQKTSPVTKFILEDIDKTKTSSFDHIVWTYHMRRMAVLVRKSYQFKEPVLLVGETGGGKTTICQMIALMNGRKLHMVNCHMHTESSDFLGNLRPVRNHQDEEEKKLFEWVDGPLIKAMQKGDFFLADEISLADDSVLERLNSLLEPERSLLLAEKGITNQTSQETDNLIIAHNDFFFVSTMNPGGDYGKKELSPALRNRFTEIWCDGCHKREDLKAIIQHNLDKKINNNQEEVANSILNFVEWLSKSDIGKRFIVSIRDILGWVRFINACLKKCHKQKLELADAYYHGACLTYIDSLGSGLTSMESLEKLSAFKKKSFAFLKQQTERFNDSSDETMDTSSDVAISDNLYGITPFYIAKGNLSPEESQTSFTFHAPMTQQNCLKILRALQLSKPILLEGSPGVGKTSLVSALAKVSGHKCMRINLSDQTDVSDLFGADLPVEGGIGGQFDWRDGPFLRALKAGDWILLDELNLASQSVLEGLNACFDHRGEVYVPELGKTFSVKPETKLFACQNPLQQGGARRGLPKSFLNRFTQVFIDALTDDDLKFIATAQYPQIDADLISKMIEFNSRLGREAGTSWGFQGAPWEMNLRDVSRWCEATISMAEVGFDGHKVYNVGSAVELIYVDRMRTKDDKNKVKDIYKEIFSQDAFPLPPFPVLHITSEKVYFKDIYIQRTNSSTSIDQNLLLLRDQMSTLRSLAQCVKMNWMSILVGSSGCGKTSIVHILAHLTGQKLKSIAVNSAMDTTEILGGFEQTDYNRHLECLIQRTEILLNRSVKTKVNKENITQIEKYQALVEEIRKFSHDEPETITMNAAMELFNRKIDGLLKLLNEMKNGEKLLANEIADITANLMNLKTLVEQDECLNAGGKFEWVDSVLVKCLREGKWLLIDQVNLCSPAVLDRLNGLLEPNGVLSIGERGIDNEGNVVTIKPHENFRLFLTMNPKYGEISRAMRNRGVEVFMLNQYENPDCGKLDYRCLLHDVGLKKRNHQEALMSVHKYMCEDCSNIDQLNVVQLLHAAFLIVQQLSRGFPVRGAFDSACNDVYIRARSISQRETKARLCAIIEEKICEFEVQEGDNYVFDLEASTCSLRSLRDNSTLALIKQQGLLLDWFVKGYCYVAKTNPELLNSLKTDFIDEFFVSDQEELSSVEVMKILPYALLNFYEHSAYKDGQLRKAWVSSLFEKSSSLKSLVIKNEIVGTNLLRYDIGVEADASLPWDRKQVKRANNLALFLYYQILIANDDMRSGWQLDNTDNIINVAQFSEAHRTGKMTIQLNNQPLIVKFVVLLYQFKKCIVGAIKNCKTSIDNSKYVALRQKLKWYNRFFDLGAKALIDKDDKSGKSSENIEEIALLLKVHYKWLKKFILFLDQTYVDKSSNITYKKDMKAFKDTTRQIEEDLATAYDPFRKMSKIFKKHVDTPLPCSSESELNASSQLKSISDTFSPLKNKFFGNDLSREPKFVTLQSEEALRVQSNLITTWHQFFMKQDFEENVIEKLGAMKLYTSSFLNNAESSEECNVAKEIESVSSKELVKIISKIQLWPIYEHLLSLFAGMFQSRVYEKLNNETSTTSLPIFTLSNHVLEIPNVPLELLSVLKALSMSQTFSKDENRLIFVLTTSFLKFKENSYATKHYKEICHWRPESKKEDDSISNLEEIKNAVIGPVLVNLVSELLLNKTTNKTQLLSSNNSSIIVDANLGEYKARLSQLKTISSILWKNSVAINSDEFSSIINDLRTLRCTLQHFLPACDKVESELYQKKYLEKNRKTNSRHVIDREYLKPLADLKRTYEKLDKDATSVNRGKAWTLLGYLQAFVFGNVGLIDPVYKVSLKLRYIEEDIIDCENTLYVANLYSRIFGMVNKYTLHPRLEEMEKSLKALKAEQESLQSQKAVRPAISEFIALSKEFANFCHALGSYPTIEKHLIDLTESLSNLEYKGDQITVEKATFVKRSAEIWLESVSCFMDRIEERFLSGYPDIIYPILAGLAQMRHGISILVEESRRLMSSSQTNLGPERLESFICNLVRFPSLGESQESLLNIVNLCTSRESRELISTSINSDNRMVTLREQFRLTMSGLYEFQNYIALKGSLTKESWVELNQLLQQIVLIWRQQQKEIERKEIENDSLYKNKAKVHGENVTEDEEIAQELKQLFPTCREVDFHDMDEAMGPSLESKDSEISITEDFIALVTENDIKEVQNIHSNIVKSFTSSEWILKRPNQSSVDFVKPLLQRYGTFGLLLDKVSPALSNDVTKKLYTSLNVLTQAVTSLSQGESFNADDQKSNQPKLYDFYRDSNVEEVKQCVLLLENIIDKVTHLLKEWPEHPTLLSIETVINRIYSFSITSPLSRFLTGLELLLVKMHQWEENAHLGVSLSDFILALTNQIIEWRKFELACWKNCLIKTQTKLQENSSKWWFFLYSLFENYASQNKMMDEQDEPVTEDKLIESLETFMKESSIVEFEARLQLLLTFHCHSYYLKASPERDNLLAITWNIHNYYSQFLPAIINRIDSVKVPIEKKLKDFVKIARWNDISYWAVKETIDKTHRTLHKFVKEYENNLKELVTPYLVLKPAHKSDPGVWDQPHNALAEIDPDDYIISLPTDLSSSVPMVKSDLIARAESHYLSRATKLCKEAILSSSYPSLRVSLEEFIDGFVTHSTKLRGLEVDLTHTKTKQRALAKSILQQKRHALADYFKCLLNMGISHRVGTLAWKNKLNEVLDFTIPPIELRAAIKNLMKVGAIEKQTLDQWDGCEKYYYGSLIKLNALNRSLANNKTDLGAQNMEWCKGFSTHLMILANNQKKTLASVVKYFVSLHTQITDLTNINTNDRTATKQKDIRSCALNLRELLVNTHASLEQFQIYLQTCQPEAVEEGEELIYSLSENDLSIADCRKGHGVWEKSDNCIKECNKVISEIANKYNQMFSEQFIVCGENHEIEDQVTVMTSKHFEFLKESFNSLKTIKDRIVELSAIYAGKDNVEHPLFQNITFLVNNISSKLADFDSLNFALNEYVEVEDSLCTDSFYEIELEKIVNMILIVIQNKYKHSLPQRTEKEELNDSKDDEEDLGFDKNMWRENLIESVEADVKSLKLRDIYQSLNSLLKTTFNVDPQSILSYSRLLQKCLPLFQQYLLLAQFYLNEQVAALRITCKILNMQLNVFLDLAINGFCTPKELGEEVGDDGEKENNEQGGMGLGDGEGQKDVSETIETEDQLEDAKPAGQEQEKPEDKECPEEEKGIEMSEDFEGKLQDVDKQEEEDKDEKEEDDLDKQIGETEDGADKLDEQIWGDDEEEQQDEETNKNDEDIGQGKETGEKEFGANDDKTEQESNDKKNDDELEKEQKEDINEMEEPQYDEDQVNPYHGQMEPPPEPEPLDLPEDINVEDENMKDEEPSNEENPFDIDKMKENMDPPEVEEPEKVTEETLDQNEPEKNDSSDDENDPEKPSEKQADVNETKEDNNEDSTEKATPDSQENDEQSKESDPEKPEEDSQHEDKALPSTDEPAKESDAAEQIDQPEGGSRDQIENKSEVEAEANDESRAENWQNEQQDKGTGQSKAEQHDSGHSGSSLEKIDPVMARDVEIEQTQKRKRPGQSDEEHKLAEQIQPDKKKLKTMIHSRDKSPEKDEVEEGAEPDDNGEQDICQHVKENEKFDHYATDAATEEQSKEQATNVEQEEPKDEEEAMEIDMHDDEDFGDLENDSPAKKNSEAVSDENQTKNKPDTKEEGKKENGQLEMGVEVDIEGEAVDTVHVARGTESNFFTNTMELEMEASSAVSIKMHRLEVENMLSQWTHIPMTEEAIAAWNTLSMVTDAAARDLTEKLRLILEPTKASRLKGDYRTGRRINMRKIIPYIASQFRKDKIWMRRTKPSKRDYQIVLAIDDSSSMANNHSKELAFESLSLISKAITYLEAGQLSVLSFGETTSILHPLGETFSEQSGTRLMQEMRFEQKKTMIAQLVDFTVDMLQTQNTSSDNAKLLVIVSDGRGVFSEGTEKVNRAIRRACLADIFIVFIIVDNPINEDSVLDIRMPIYQDGKLVRIGTYMDNFPFPFYMILRDINVLPGVLSDALRQWFELVGKIDS